MIPDWMLERYRLHELGADEATRVSTALAADAELRARLAALDADDGKILAALPPEQVAHRVRSTRTVVADAPRRAPRWVPVLALAGAAAALLVAALPSLTHTSGADDVRLKGTGPTLRVFRLTAHDPERLGDGARVQPHDVVQVAFDLAGATHLVVVSVDGGGHTTLHWPLDGNSQAAVGFKALPQSFELDEAPGFERFFLVTSDQPLSTNAVLEAAAIAARGGTLALPGPVIQRSVLLDKVPR